MENKQQKTIFLSLPYCRSVSSVLRTGVFLSLKQKNFKIVILSPFSKSIDFINEFSGKDIFFEYIEDLNDNEIYSFLVLLKKAMGLVQACQWLFLFCPFKKFAHHAVRYIIASIEFKYKSKNLFLNYFIRISIILGRVFLIAFSIVSTFPIFFIFYFPFIKIEVIRRYYYKFCNNYILGCMYRIREKSRKFS